MTQGAIGAALPLATRHKAQAIIATASGFLAGIAPDLDVLIRDSADTLLFLDYHRQFTHSIAFIPIGSAIVAGTFYFVLRRWLSVGFLKLWLFCALGYATHGVLDAATSYGTLLFWPFDDTRYAFSIISIVDPLFTLPVLGLVGFGLIKGNGRWGRVALLWAFAYLMLGAYQHQAAYELGRDLAAKRGHEPSRLQVKPTFGNVILWKSIYETRDRFYIDAVRPGPWPAVFIGESTAKLDIARDFSWLDPGSQQARDIDRFTEFSDGFVAKAADDGERVIDIRYSFLPTRIAPLWSIRLDPEAGPGRHAIFETHRADARREFPALLSLIIGNP